MKIIFSIFFMLFSTVLLANNYVVPNKIECSKIGYPACHNLMRLNNTPFKDNDMFLIGYLPGLTAEGDWQLKKCTASYPHTEAGEVSAPIVFCEYVQEEAMYGISVSPDRIGLIMQDKSNSNWNKHNDYFYTCNKNCSFEDYKH